MAVRKVFIVRSVKASRQKWMPVFGKSDAKARS
jgi:hypothetical protein